LRINAIRAFRDRQTPMKQITFISVVAVALIACACTAPAPARVAGTTVAINSPLGLPPIPIPSDNPPTAESIELGRKLFFDVRLSADNTISCATCHDPQFSFTDGMKSAKGIQSQTGRRNTPTIVNSAFYPMLFLDGRAASLEQQAGGPMENPIEMGQPHEVTVAKIDKVSEYKEEFQKVFGLGPITIGKIEMALASFERTMVSGDSPFDRYLYKDDKTALSPEAIRGLAIFTDKKRGNCSTCHTIGETYALFTDGKFHNIGAGINSSGEMTDLGRFDQTKNEADKGAFRTPGLRNVALTAPYMHDGSLKTLKDVVDFYAGGGTSNPELDPEIGELKLSGRERADLVAFLESLTGKPAESRLRP
jgi:cytochrome c peroxidase